MKYVDRDNKGANITRRMRRLHGKSGRSGRIVPLDASGTVLPGVILQDGDRAVYSGTTYVYASGRGWSVLETT